MGLDLLFAVSWGVKGAIVIEGGGGHGFCLHDEAVSRRVVAAEDGADASERGSVFSVSLSDDMGFGLASDRRERGFPLHGHRVPPRD
jgi:hypothetical protein